MNSLPLDGGLMARYYFSVQNGRSFDDIDGLELSNMAEVRAEASAFARDLMRLEPLRRDWSRWVVLVTDDEGKFVMKLPFPDAAQINL